MGGGGSQIETELFLFESAAKTGVYAYYHLLSGQDLCIKPQRELHEFFNANQGKEFICFSGKDWQRNMQQRVRYYHMQSGRNNIKAYINSAFVKIQKLLRIDRRKKCDLTFVGGSNWVSITNDFCTYLLENKDVIFKIFKHTRCADEVFIHTMAYNSEFKNSIYLINERETDDNADEIQYRSNMRIIDWSRGNPYTLDCDDFDWVINSPYMFMRKADSQNGLPQKILEWLDCCQ